MVDNILEYYNLTFPSTKKKKKIAKKGFILDFTVVLPLKKR